MTTNTSRLIASAAALALLGSSSAVLAQARAAAAPAAAGQTVSGPVIPGVCIFSNERALQTSAVGKAVIARMGVLAQAVNTELTPEKNAIQAEDRQIASQRATLSQEQLGQRVVALRQRAAGLEQRAQIRGRELEATQQKQLQRISTEMQPVLKQVYDQRNCGLLLDRNSVIAGNAQMDVTDQVVQGLNGRITTLSFEREHIDVPQAAAAPAAAQPAPAATPRRK